MSVEMIPEFESLPESWDLRPLVDLVSEDRKISYGIVQPGFHDDSGVPIIRVNNIRQNRIVADDVMRVSAEIEKQYKRTRIQGGELLVTLVGSLGEVAIADDKYRGWNLARAVGVVPIADPAIAEWVKFYLGSRIAKYFIGMWANTTVQHTLNLKDLAQLPVPLPPTGERQELIELIGSLDEKLELNRKQNRTLEAIAQALFKRWFVEFAFPDANGRPYKSSGGVMQPSALGEIPVGWEVGCIGDFVEHKKDGINPGDQPDKQFFHFSIPNFDDGQAAKPELGSTILSNKYLVVQDSILVSKLNPRFPRIWPVFGIPGERSVCSTEFQVLSPVEGAFGFVLRLLKSPLVASEMVSRASGTSGSHQRINPDDLFSIEVIKPAKNVIERFHLTVLDGIRKSQANLEQNRVLGEVRDTLLPKLMSGELRVA